VGRAGNKKSRWQKQQQSSSNSKRAVMVSVRGKQLKNYRGSEDKKMLK
jgi:hypothetical protein